MKRRTAYLTALTFGAAASAGFAHTGPGAITHAAATTAATVAGFYLVFVLSHLPGEYRRRRTARATARTVAAPTVIEADLTPSGTMSTDEIDEHWRHTDAGVNVGLP